MGESLPPLPRVSAVSFGPHSQGTLQEGSGDHLGYWGSNPVWLLAGKCPTCCTTLQPLRPQFLIVGFNTWWFDYSGPHPAVCVWGGRGSVLPGAHVRTGWMLTSHVQPGARSTHCRSSLWLSSWWNLYYKHRKMELVCFIFYAFCLLKTIMGNQQHYCLVFET